MSQEFEQDFSIELRRGGVSEADVAALIAGIGKPQQSALAMYRIHREAGALDQYRLLTYRCPRRCLLLDVFRTPAGPALYLPPFKLSPQHNANSSTEDARIERTSDGIRRWIERAEMLSTLGSGGRRGLLLHLNCDHVLESPLGPQAIRDDLAARRSGAVIVVSGNAVP